MSVWSKTGSAAWTKINSLFVKTGSVTWTEMLSAWVKTGSSTWTQVFVKLLVPANTVLPDITGSTYLYGTLTGSLGTWTSPNGTNSYARQWQRASNSGGVVGAFSAISGATSSTYTTTDSDDNKFICLRVTATNLSGSTTAQSYEYLIKKYAPVALSTYSLSGVAIVGGTLSAFEQIGTWKGTTTITGDTSPNTFEYEWSWSDGTIRKSTAFNSINSNTYTIVAGDLGKIIRVRVTGTNSGGSATTGYTSSGTVTNTYAFNFGNTLYVGSNGYIGLDGGGSTAASPGSGRNINIYSNDLVQYKLQEYSDSSNYYLYFRSYNYQSPLVRAANNAVDYQIKFYTDQAYCDIYIVRKGSSVPIQTQGPGYYSSGFTGYAGIPGPYFWGAGSVLRSYFNGSTGSQTAFTWTAIDDAVWKDITTSDIDDSFTSVVTTANQQAPVPTTPTALSAEYNSSGQIELTFSGGTGDQYDLYYAGNDLRPTDKQAFADFSNVTSVYTATTLTTRDATRYFWVRKSTGTLRSNWYPAAGGVVTRIPLFAPPVPNTPTTSGVSKTNITVSWTAGTATTTTDSGTSFEVYTSDTNSTPATTDSGTTKTSPASYTYTASTSPATQYFWVRAVNKDAKSAWSAVASATPTASKPPTAPTSITAGTKTNTSIAWSWTAPTATTTNNAATGYEYKHTTDNTTPTSGWTAQTGTSVTISSLTKNTTYYMHVRATNADGTSASDYNSASTNNDNFYTVTFSVNGSGGTAPTSVTQSTSGGSVTLAAAITRTGYTFGGWNIATDGTGTNRGAGTSYTPSADITLYAKWTVAYAAVVWGSMPNPAFTRSGGNLGSTSTSYRWGWDNQIPTSGDYTATNITWEWQHSTSNTTTTQSANPAGLLVSGTRPNRTAGGLTVGSSTYNNRVSSLSGDYNSTSNIASSSEPVAFSTSARYLRYRAVVTGTDGTVYRSNYSGWV